MVQRKKEVDGDLFIPGSITVLGGINSSAYRKTVTTLARTEADVADIRLTKPDYNEVVQEYFETRYTRSASAPATPTGDDPVGWTVSIPATDPELPLWMSGVMKSAQGVALQAWYSPVRFTNAATVVPLLTNEFARVPTDADGNNGNYVQAKSKLLVYEGTADKTSEFTPGFTASPSGSITFQRLDDAGNVDVNGRTVHVTDMTVDTGEIIMSGVRSGLTVEKRFQIYKARLGDQSPVYSMLTSSVIVLVKPDLTRTPSTLTINATSQVGLSEPQPYAGIFKFFLEGQFFFQSAIPQSEYVWTGVPLFPSLTLYPSTMLIPAPVFDGQDDLLQMRIELWDASAEVQLDAQTVTFMADWENYIEDIQEGVLDKAPRYLGRFNATMPSTYHKGDWWLVYDTDDEPYERGVYFYDGVIAPFRITDAAGTNSGLIVEALPDILWAVKNGYGDTTLYGAVTYIENLVTNAIFTNHLRVGFGNLDSTVISGGQINTQLINTAAIKAAQGFFDNITVTGKALVNELLYTGLAPGNVVIKRASDLVTTGGTQSLYSNRQICGTGTVRVKFNLRVTVGGGTITCVVIRKRSGAADVTVYSESFTSQSFTWAARTFDTGILEGDYLRFEAKRFSGGMGADSYFDLKDIYICSATYPGFMSWIGSDYDTASDPVFPR